MTLLRLVALVVLFIAAVLAITSSALVGGGSLTWFIPGMFLLALDQSIATPVVGGRL